MCNYYEGAWIKVLLKSALGYCIFSLELSYSEILFVFLVLKVFNNFQVDSAMREMVNEDTNKLVSNSLL
jgi:hypothetical protein